MRVKKIELLSAMYGFICVMVLSGCSSSSREERRWTEDVLLDDGSTVQIERYVAFDATNAMGGGAYNAVEAKATLRFTGELTSLPEWDEPLIPLLVYRDNDDWVVVARSSSCEVWSRREKPMPPYWEFRVNGDRWDEVPLSCDSIGRATNLYYEYHSENQPQHVSLSLKQKIDSNPGTVDSYRRIVSATEVRENYCMGGTVNALTCESIKE